MLLRLAYLAVTNTFAVLRLLPMSNRVNGSSKLTPCGSDGLILVVDKGYRDRDTETWLNDNGITVIRPAYRTEPARPGRGLLRAVRQSIESVNQTFKGQLDLEQHGGRTITGVAVRVLQRLLAVDRRSSSACVRFSAPPAAPLRSVTRSLDSATRSVETARGTLNGHPDDHVR